MGEGFTPGKIVDNFDCDWAEVEFDTAFNQTLSKVYSSYMYGIYQCINLNICFLLQTIRNPETIKFPFLISDPEEFETISQLYESCYEKMLRYKTCNLEMDISNKSDRAEWGHLRYQGLFFPDATLEFIFQWGVCTGPLVAELIQNWLRKAQNCGVNLVPIPCDPFALPMSHKADPLRAPIYVPLDLDSLNDEDKHFLHDFPQKSWPQRILLFQVNHFLK